MSVIFIFSIHRVVQPVNTDKIVNFAQHPKSFGTAAIHGQKSKRSISYTFKYLYIRYE